MPFYVVSMRREVEWENIYEAEDEEVAKDLARLEAHHGTVTDEQVLVMTVEQADCVD